VGLIAQVVITNVAVGRRPYGIVLSPDGTTAYVNNTLAGTVSVIDTYTVTTVITVTDIPLPPVLLPVPTSPHHHDSAG